MAITPRSGCSRTALIVDSSSTPTEEARFGLSLLGPFEATRNGHPLSFATDAARALLAYLAVESGRHHRREFLATLLWPEQSQSAAFANLRQTLARLRRGLGEPLAAGALTVTRQTLEIDSDAVDLDCARFERLMKSCAEHGCEDIARCRACIQRLEQACRLYRGDFLDGVFPGSSQLFDEWTLARRERYRLQALNGLYALASYSESIADYEAARRYAAQQLELEPWREEAHRQLMRALALQGRRTAALEQYETCRGILADELGIEPDTETRALYERIRDDALAPEVLRAPAPAHNLPAQLTPFVGREEELRTISSRLDDPDVRLLTLVGAGGMGKTRLGLEVANQRLNRYPDGVFFVPLAPVARPDAIAASIATAMGLMLSGDIRRNLPLALQDKQALLLLDNFDHLVDGVGDIVELLERAPGLQLLVTSRERLNVLSEHVYAVRGMEYGGLEGSDPLSGSAIRLFAQSVRRIRPDFAIREDNLAVITRICELVEGMPLALELAAAWADMLPLDEIAREIERSADFLTSDWQDAPERHRSLRAVFEGSWRALDESERGIFRQLSVFRGGFTREAAEVVAGASLRALVRLGHKSLLHQQAGRYQIHDLLRQFGAEQLDSSAEERAAVEQRHSVHYLTFVADRQLALDGAEPQRAAGQILAEIDNIGKAWMSAIRYGLISELDASAFGLWRFYSLGGASIDVERFMRLAAERLKADLEGRGEEGGPASRRDERILSKLRALQAAALVSQGDYDASIPVAEEAIARGKASGGAEGETFGYLSKGQALSTKAQYPEAQRSLERALSRARRSLSEDGFIDSLDLIEYLVYLWLGAIAIRQSQHARAGDFFEQSLSICRRRGDLRGEIHCLANLGNAARSAHAYSSAREHYEVALDLARQSGYRWGAATAQQELGDVIRLQGDPEFARQLTERSLAIYRDIGDRMREAVSLAYLGRLSIYLGDDAGSRAYLDRFLHVIEGVDAPFAEDWGWVALAIQHDRAGDAVGALAYARRAVAAAERVGSHVDHADALVVTAQILAGMKQLDEARRAYQRAIELCGGVEGASEAITARAGLAVIALENCDRPEALVQVEMILSTQQADPDAGSDQPFAIQLICYRVLDALDDPRAPGILARAHRNLLSYADGIADSALRHSFLENVPAHRELQETHSASLTPDAL